MPCLMEKAFFFALRFSSFVTHLFFTILLFNIGTLATVIVLTLVVVYS